MNKRDGRVDLLKALAIVMVVAIHTFCVVDADRGGWFWSVQFLVNQFAHCAVPIFMMVTGAFSLKAMEEPLKFYRRRLGRLVVPTLLMSVIYIGFRLLRHESLSTIAHESLHGMPYYHLWYAYMLIVLTLVLPFLAAFASRVPRWAVALTGVAVVLSPRWTGTDGWCAIILGIGYALLGMAIYPWLQGRVSISGALATTIVALPLTIWGGWVGLKSLGVGSMGYASPFVFGSSVCLFAALLLMPYKGELPFLSRLARMTFGVYLVHPIVKFAPGLCKRLFPATDAGMFAYALFSFVVVLVGSVLLVEMSGWFKGRIQHLHA